MSMFYVCSLGSFPCSCQSDRRSWELERQFLPLLHQVSVEFVGVFFFSCFLVLFLFFLCLLGFHQLGIWRVSFWGLCFLGDFCFFLKGLLRRSSFLFLWVFFKPKTFCLGTAQLSFLRGLKPISVPLGGGLGLKTLLLERLLGSPVLTIRSCSQLLALLSKVKLNCVSCVCGVNGTFQAEQVSSRIGFDSCVFETDDSMRIIFGLMSF